MQLRAAIGGRAPARDEPGGLESREHAAEVTRVERERLGERGGRRLRHLSELVDHARLGQRVRRIEQALVQEPDLARPEAAEAAGAVRGCGEHFHRNYLPVSTRLLVNCNYIPHVDPVQRDAATTRPTPATSQPDGICVSTTTPMTVAIAGRSETISA